MSLLLNSFPERRQAVSSVSLALGEVSRRFKSIKFAGTFGVKVKSPSILVKITGRAVLMFVLLKRKEIKRFKLCEKSERGMAVLYVYKDVW